MSFNLRARERRPNIESLLAATAAAMGHDAAAYAAPRDIAGKKKRGSRSAAKLKQCKLDARREQWLSQVKSKDSRIPIMASSPTSPLPPPPPLSLPGAPMGRRRPTEETAAAIHDSSDSESPMHSPTGSVSRERPPPNRIGSRCSVESSSRTVSDAELEEEGDVGGDNGALDDWEAVADALSADCGGIVKPDTAPDSQERPLDQTPAKQEPVRTAPRAWRLDDASRPRCLPSLLKQRSLMVDLEPRCGGLYGTCGVFSLPTMCPICCEDLDLTDSSFLPCLCGFRLCLFCYKRILEDDGRCPGCRKHYGGASGEALNGGDGCCKVSHRISRSMSSRS